VIWQFTSSGVEDPEDIKGINAQLIVANDILVCVGQQKRPPTRELDIPIHIIQ
jgi:hypothetical protein